MTKRFIGNREVKKTRKTRRGEILVKLFDPATGKTTRELMTPSRYESQIRYE